MKEASRYHPLLVILHWLITVLLMTSLLLGFFELASIPNSARDKLYSLQMHMVVGMIVLLLMLISFVMRLTTSRPKRASTGNAVLDAVAVFVNYSFYVLVPLMAVTGYATAIQAQLPQIVFARSGAPLPENFNIYASSVAHRYLAILLTVMICIHIFISLYHHLVLKDGLVRRMLLGGRAINRLREEK